MTDEEISAIATNLLRRMFQRNSSSSSSSSDSSVIEVPDPMDVFIRIGNQIACPIIMVFPLNKSASGSSETPIPQITFFHQPHQHPSHPHSSLTAAHLFQLNGSSSVPAVKGGVTGSGVSNHLGHIIIFLFFF
jgi:hypothetical protein